MSTDFAYIADSILIEKLAADSIVKQAGFGEELLGGIGPAVSSFVKSHIDTSSTGALIKSILKLFSAGFLFRAHPVLGFMEAAAQKFFHISIVDVVSSLFDSSSIKGKLMSGEPVTAEDVNQAGQGLVSAASLDYLHELDNGGFFTKFAGPGPVQPLGGSFLREKNAPLISRLFGFLAQKKPSTGRGIIGGIAVWLVKTALLSAGLLGTGALVKSLVTDEPEEGAKVDSEPTQSNSGRVHPNNNQTPWYLPVLNGSVKDTLLNWALEIYPKLSGYESIILNNSAFNKVADEFARDYESGKDYVRVPPQYNTVKGIVDQFANSITRPT